jgi:hypothetical protein
VLAGVLVLPAASAISDGVRASATYVMQFDAITAGGGENSSASYRQPESSLGENLPWAISTSASYSNQTGDVLWGSFVPVTLSRFEAE